jgi:uncharacterized protein (TIRG00374 family)
MKNTVVGIVKALVTVLLFVILFRRVDFNEFIGIILNARLELIGAAFLILWVGHYICIFRWRMLMRPLMPVLSFGRLFGIYCIGLFFNLTFPTVVGGDVVKMYYAGKPSRQYARSFAATFLDRDAGMLAMMIIACCAAAVRPVIIPGIPVPFIIWSAFAAFIAANILIFAPAAHRGFVFQLNRFQLTSMAVRVDAISSAFQVMAKHGPVLGGSLVISLFNQLLVIAVTWVAAVGLRIDVPFSYFLVFVPVITLISMIPVSLNGMGLREYAYLSLFGALGVAHESCIALGLLSSAMIVLSSLPGGVIYIFFRNQSDAKQMAAVGADFS